MLLMVHRPKLVRSSLPYGLAGNMVVSKRIADDLLETSEFWNASPKPLWKIGASVIARKGYTWKKTWELGKHFVVTRFYTAAGDLVGTYWDICSEVRMLGSDFVFEDWYLDVWFPMDGKLQLLDESELKEAVEKQYISLADADTAKWTAFRILELYTE